MREPFIYGITLVVARFRLLSEALPLVSTQSQLRVIIKAKSKKRMMELLCLAKMQTNPAFFNSHGSKSGNAEELAATKEVEEGVWVAALHGKQEIVRVL